MVLFIFLLLHFFRFHLCHLWYATKKKVESIILSICFQAESLRSLLLIIVMVKWLN